MLFSFHPHETVKLHIFKKRTKYTQTLANFEMTASRVLKRPRVGNRKPTLTSRVWLVVRSTACWEIIHPYTNLVVHATETSVCQKHLLSTHLSIRRAERH